MGKEYVDVLLTITNEREVTREETKEIIKITPLYYKSPNREKWIKIKNANNSPYPMPSKITGGIGVRYTCTITIHETAKKIYLFYEGNHKWWIENENEKKKGIIYCPWGGHEITEKPIFELHQTRWAVKCPYCGQRIIDWQDTKEEAVVAWDKFIRNDINILPE